MEDITCLHMDMNFIFECSTFIFECSNIEAVFFKLGTSNVRHKRNTTFDTHYVVAMVTLLAPVSFCEKPNIPICNLLKLARGSCLENTWLSYCLNCPH